MTTKANRRPQMETSEPPLARLLQSTPTGKMRIFCAMSENSLVQGTPTEMATRRLRTFIRKRQNKNQNSEHDLHERRMRDVQVHAHLE